jgi:ketosteroid isomerase-like protein
MDLGELMDRLFDAFAHQDAETLRAMSSDDFTARRNGSPSVGLDDMLGMLGETLWNAGVSSSYSDIRRVVGDRAVAEQHLVTLTRPDGKQVDIDVCVIVRFDGDGLIVGLDEYADSAQLAPLMS